MPRAPGIQAAASLRGASSLASHLPLPLPRPRAQAGPALGVSDYALARSWPPCDRVSATWSPSSAPSFVSSSRLSSPDRTSSSLLCASPSPAPASVTTTRLRRVRLRPRPQLQVHLRPRLHSVLHTPQHHDHLRYFHRSAATAIRASALARSRSDDNHGPRDAQHGIDMDGRRDRGLPQEGRHQDAGEDGGNGGGASWTDLNVQFACVGLVVAGLGVWLAVSSRHTSTIHEDPNLDSDEKGRKSAARRVRQEGKSGRRET